MAHTRVCYWVKPTRERKAEYDYVFENVELLTPREADDYMDYGRPGNFLIENVMDISKFGTLENWGVSKVTIYQDADLEYIDVIRKAEADIKRFKRQAAASRRETKKLQAEIAKLDEKNRVELRRLGWASLTDDEATWYSETYLQTGKAPLFLPSAEQIKGEYFKAQKVKDAKLVDPFEGFEELRSTNGWLDPYGKYVPVKGFAQHNEWASEYFQEHGIEEEAGVGYAYEQLQNLGWIRIMDWGAGSEISFGYYKQPTHEQKETLYLFCALHKVKNPFA